MRIIGGILKGRRLKPPANLPVRPTTDLAKESLFNILNNIVDFEGLEVLDLFAGTGNISFEFASRQAARVIAVDANPRCIEYIRKTAREFQMTNLVAWRADVFVFLKRPPDIAFDLVFSDAPFEMEGTEVIPELVFGNHWLKKDGLLVIEHSGMLSFAGHPRFSQERRYGKVHFSFFENS